MATSARIYQNFILDSTRWDYVPERPGDVVIATPYKCGTTWTQNIVLHLIFQDLKVRAIGDYSPWVDMRLRPMQELLEVLEGQKHRRCLKSHLPRDGLYLRENTKYIVVGRDPRDVFMSFWNHYSNYTEMSFVEMNDTPGRVGPPLMRCPDDIRELWDMWINRGWFDWETEGYPHWSNLRHVRRGGTTESIRTSCLCITMTCWQICRVRLAELHDIWTSNARRICFRPSRSW